MNRFLPPEALAILALYTLACAAAIHWLIDNGPRLWGTVLGLFTGAIICAFGLPILAAWEIS